MARTLLDAVPLGCWPSSLLERIANDPDLFWLRGEEQPPGV